MRFVKAFGRFWYDFIIGDDWKVAATVVTVLGVAALLLASGVGGAAVPPLLGMAIIVGFVVTMLADVGF